MADKSSYLPNMLGPLDLQVDGADAGVPRRTKFNLVGIDVEDDPANERTNLTVPDLSGPVTDAEVTWSPTDYSFVTSKSYQQGVTTTGATATTALLIPISDETAIDVTATVIGRGESSEYFRLDLRGGWYRTNGAVVERDAPSTADPPSMGNPGSWAAVLDLSGTNVRVRVTGAASTTVRWSVLADVQSVSLDAVPGGFDPATMTLTGWWRASYSGSPWTPTASAGSSGSNGNLTEGTNPPATGTAQNGLTPADFDGTNDLITAANAMSTFVTAGAGSIAVLFRADTSAAPGAGVYDDEPIFCDAGGNLAIGFSTSGVRAGIYDTSAAWKETGYVTCATGAYHLAQMRWNGTTLEVRIDSGAWTSTACQNAAVLTSYPQLGKNYNVSYFDGRILDVILDNIRWSDTDADNLVTYVNDRYGLAL